MKIYVPAFFVAFNKCFFKLYNLLKHIYFASFTSEKYIKNSEKKFWSLRKFSNLKSSSLLLSFYEWNILKNMTRHFYSSIFQTPCVKACGGILVRSYVVSGHQGNGSSHNLLNRVRKVLHWQLWHVLVKKKVLTAGRDTLSSEMPASSIV